MVMALRRRIASAAVTPLSVEEERRLAEVLDLPCSPDGAKRNPG